MVFYVLIILFFCVFPLNEDKAYYYILDKIMSIKIKHFCSLLTLVDHFESPNRFFRGVCLYEENLCCPIIVLCLGLARHLTPNDTPRLLRFVIDLLASFTSLLLLHF